MRAICFATDLFCLFLGLSTLGYWAVYLLGGSFDHFAVVAGAAAAAALTLSLLAGSSPDEPEEPPPDGRRARWPDRRAQPRPDGRRARWPDRRAQPEAASGLTRRQLLFGSAAAVVAASSVLVSDRRLFWLMMLAAGTLVAFGLGGRAAPAHSRSGSAPQASQIVLLLLLALVATGATLASHRADSDDEYYVSVMVAASDTPGIPLPDLPVMRSAWGLASYQIILTWLARLTGAPILIIYYIVAPALAAFVGILVGYRLLSELTGRPAVTATAVLLAVLLFWGDVHRSPGNFAFVRLFQGKAVFCVAVAPALLLYAVRQWRRPSRWGPVLLGAALAAGMGTTQTVVLIGPLFLLMVAPFLLPRTWRSLPREGEEVRPALGRLAREAARDLGSLWPVALPLLMAAVMLIVVGQGPEGATTNIVGPTVVVYTLGTGIRGALGLASLLALPLMVQRELRAPCALSVALMVVIGFSPPLGHLLDVLNGTSTWRVTWVMPFAPATAAALCAVSDVAGGNGSAGRGLALVAALLGYAWLGTTTLAPETNRLGAPRPKLPRQESVRLRLFGDTSYPIVAGRVCLDPRRCY